MTFEDSDGTDIESPDSLVATFIEQFREECPDIVWMFYHETFEMLGLDAMQIYIYDQGGTHDDCDVYFIDQDTSSPNSYGTCEIVASQYVNLHFASGDHRTYAWTSQIASTEINTEEAIARFIHEDANGISWLWFYCDTSA